MILRDSAQIRAGTVRGPLAVVAYDAERCESEAEFASLVLEELGWQAERFRTVPPSALAVQAQVDGWIEEAQAVVVIVQDRERPLVSHEIEVAARSNVPTYLFIRQRPPLTGPNITPELEKFLSTYDATWKAFDSLNDFRAALRSAIAEAELRSMKPRVTLICKFDEAIVRSRSQQIRATDRVKIVSANRGYNDEFKRYVLSVLQGPARVARIIDLKRWESENVANHLFETWEYLREPKDELPKYDVRFTFGGAGSLGSVAVLGDDSSASFFLYLERPRCLYLETNDTPAVDAASERYDELAHGPRFRTTDLTGSRGEAAILSYVKGVREMLASKP